MLQGVRSMWLFASFRTVSIAFSGCLANFSSTREPYFNALETRGTIFTNFGNVCRLCQVLRRFWIYGQIDGTLRILELSSKNCIFMLSWRFWGWLYPKKTMTNFLSGLRAKLLKHLRFSSCCSKSVAHSVRHVLLWSFASWFMSVNRFFSQLDHECAQTSW